MSVVSVPPQTPEPELSFLWHIVASPEDKGSFVPSVFPNAYLRRKLLRQVRAFWGGSRSQELCKMRQLQGRLGAHSIQPPQERVWLHLAPQHLQLLQPMGLLALEGVEARGRCQFGLAAPSSLRKCTGDSP